MLSVCPKKNLAELGFKVLTVMTMKVTSVLKEHVKR
jgi:hypothetical protein